MPLLLLNIRDITRGLNGNISAIASTNQAVFRLLFAFFKTEYIYACYRNSLPSKLKPIPDWALLDITLYTTAQKLLPYSPIATNTCVLSNFCTYFFCHCVPINKLFWTIRMFSFPSFVSNIGTNFHFLILFTLWIYNVRFRFMIRQCYVEAFWIHIILHFNGIFM